MRGDPQRERVLSRRVRSEKPRDSSFSVICHGSARTCIQSFALLFVFIWYCSVSGVGHNGISYFLFISVLFLATEPTHVWGNALGERSDRTMGVNMVLFNLRRWRGMSVSFN